MFQTVTDECLKDRDDVTVQTALMVSRELTEIVFLTSMLNIFSQSTFDQRLNPSNCTFESILVRYENNYCRKKNLIGSCAITNRKKTQWQTI